MTRICIVETGYLGMACAIGFSELGARVLGYDVTTDRIVRLRNGKAPYRADGVEAALGKHLASGALSLHENLIEAVVDADLIVLAVETPSRAEGRCGLVVDGRNALDPDRVAAAGIHYWGYGRHGSGGRLSTDPVQAASA